MAMETNRHATSLVLELEVEDDEGNLKRKYKSIFKISPNAENEAVYNIGRKAGELVKYKFGEVIRVNKDILLG